LSAFWLDPDSIIHGGPDALLAAEIPFRSLDRNVAKQELYLFQFAACCVAQPRASPSQVVRRQLFDGGFRGALTNDVPDDLLSMRSPPSRPALFTQRNNRPEVIPASFSQTSRTALTQSGIGTVRM
jgi:hypothetical protein